MPVRTHTNDTTYNRTSYHCHTSDHIHTHSIANKQPNVHPTVNDSMHNSLIHHF